MIKNTVTDIVKSIHTMNNEELNQIIEAVKLQRTYLDRTTTRTLRAGATVSFVDRRGVKVVGTVTKVNRKTVEVRGSMSNGIFNTNYRVPACMLKIEEYSPAAEAVGV